MTSKKKQFGINAVSGWVAQLVFAGIGFILLPYCINRLGEQGYGIYQLARSALVFFMFLQLGMGPSLVRFCAQAVAKNDLKQIKEISSTAQFILGSLGLFAALLCLSLIPVFISFYEIPAEFVSETRGLLVCISLSLFLNMMLIVPLGLVYGANRYDLGNIVDICGHVLRLILIIILFEFFRPSVFYVGVAILSASCFRFVMMFMISAKQFGRAVFFSIRNVNRVTMRSILGFSMLNLANSVASAVVFQGPVLIIGKVLGEEMVTAFAPALLIASAMQGFLGQTSRPLVPIASRDVEENSGKNIGKWAISIGQVSAFVGFAIVLLLATFGPEVITLWLGDNLGWTWSVVVVLATGVAISQVQATNYFLALGGGSITPTVYSQIVMAIVVFTGTVVGTVWFDWHLMEVALLIALSLLLRNTFYLAYTYSHQFSYSFSKYLTKVYVLPMLIVSFCICIGWGLKNLVAPVNVTILVVESVGILIFFVF
ncbi:lipopolysaccharide biosynthesis protein, partial [bacterium]|nr:lipopolysaccharide biosynthesis protein [bacterium]